MGSVTQAPTKQHACWQCCLQIAFSCFLFLCLWIEEASADLCSWRALFLSWMGTFMSTRLIQSWKHRQ